MVYAHQCMFQRVGKWSVSYIVQQCGKSCCYTFIFIRYYILGPELVQCLAHKVARAQRMCEARMLSTRVYQVSQSHLFYQAQPLKTRMVYNPYQLRLREADKTINGIIYYLYLDAHK